MSCTSTFYRIITAVVLIAIGLSLIGCGGGGGSSEPSLTQNQADRIMAASTAVSQAVDDSVSGSPLNDAAGVARGQSGVEGTTVTDDALIVRYTDGGSEIWMHDDPEDKPPTDIPDVAEATAQVVSRVRATRTPIGTRNAVIINSFAGDATRAARLPYFQGIVEMLQAAGLNVAQYTEDTCTPDVLKSIQDRSLILLSGHGCPTGDPSNPYYTMAGRWHIQYYLTTDYLAGRIVRLHNVDNRGDFFALNAAFWRNAYSSHHFNHGLFMNLTCFGSAYSTYRQSLCSCGVDEYTGWSDAQGIAVFTAWRIISHMVTGKTLQQAVDLLPYASLHDNTADFWYGPDEHRDITLNGTSIPTTPGINITSPTDGSTIHSVGCTVTGTISPWSSSYHATIGANGNSSALIVGSDGSFSQVISLTPGAITPIDHLGTRAVGDRMVRPHKGK